MWKERLRKYMVTLLSAIFIIAVFWGLNRLMMKEELQTVKVGIIYVDDASAPYTNNFIKAQNAAEEAFGERIEMIAKYNPDSVTPTSQLWAKNRNFTALPAP